jgi:hypothetical protein
MTSAPHIRSVDALSGQRAPTAFFRALSEADEFVHGNDRLRELETRLQELSATPSLAERMRAAAETIRELNSLCGVGLNASVSPVYLDAEAARMEM